MVYCIRREARTFRSVFLWIMAKRHEHIQSVRQALLDWYERHSRDLPWRRTRDPYYVLVSEIMLQQTQVDRVLPKYHAFLERFPTLADLAAAAPGDVIRAWAGLGYNRRALNLQRTAQAVLNEHGGKFPQTPDELQRLPGIGPYTAGAVACFAFERDVAFMDTNIRRVIQRAFVGPEEVPPATTERQLQTIAQEAVPAGNGYTWNQAIMELGALVCTSARPRCAICPIQSHCRAYATWKAADETIFTAPPAPRPARAVAESRAPFTTSNRYFRGRFVALLRELPPGGSATLADLGPRIKDGWTAAELDWLMRVAQGLADDGLIVLEAQTGTTASARLP
jgi:A/G-specific adenine glycosylase